MTQHIKPAISGLNSGHALNGNILKFFEFGQLDKELVSDTALTISAAPVVTDADIGTARQFVTGSSVSDTFSVSVDSTVLVVLAARGSRLYSGAGLAFVNLNGGSAYRLDYSASTNGRFRSTIRSNAGAYRELYSDSFANDAAFNTGHAVAAHFADTETMKTCLNGVIGTATNTGTTNAFVEMTASLLQNASASDDFSVGAIVIFDKLLSDAELQSVTSDPWALTAVANVAPVIDTPEPDLTIPTDATVNVDFGATASDANGDAITVTVSPALPSGLTLSPQGVMTNTGALSITAAADYTFAYDDGNGGTVDDVVNIEIVAPVFRVDSVSTTTPAANSNFTISTSNAEGALSAHVVVNSTNYALTVVDETNGVLTLTAPVIPDFADQTVDFNDELTVVVSDGSTEVNAPNAIRVQKETGYDYSTITTPSNVGNYKNADGDVSGLPVYSEILSGDPVGDYETGIFIVTEASSMRHRFYDGAWGDWFTVNFEAPAAQVNQAPTANPQTFSITEDAANSIQIGQFIATDSDGTIDGSGYSSSNAKIGISTGGMLLLVDNSGLTAGTPLTTTISFRDDDGAIGTATVTVNVTTVTQQVAQPIANTQNPLPASFYILVGTHYELAQHVTNPDSATLNYAVAQNSPALPTGITLNATTGRLTSTDNNYSPVSGISFEVTLA